MGEMYRISFPNGKAYIGITAGTAQKRFASHLYSLKRGEALLLYHALRKYGVDAATVETLVMANDWAALCEMERRAIAAFGTRSPGGYNATDGGDGAPKGNLFRVGVKHSDATKARMSADRKGQPRHTPESKARLAATMRGNKFALGVKPSPETVAKRARSIMTSRGRKENSSGHKGVSWCRYTSRWRAHISTGGKMRTIGRYANLADAVSARRSAERIHLEMGAGCGT